MLIPLVIAAASSIVLTCQQAFRREAKELQNQAILISQLTADDLMGAIRLVETVAADLTLIDAVQAGSQQVEAEGLQNLTIEALKQRFTTTKLLQPNSSLNRYLRTIAENSNFAEIFVTEENGFNIAYSEPTSDFVQSDELWWQEGKKEGQWVDNPSFDESTQAVTIDLVSKLISPETGEFLGMIKGGYDFVNIQRIVSEIEQVELSGSEQIQIFQPGDNPVVIASITAIGKSQSQDIVGGEVVLQKAAELIIRTNPGLGKSRPLVTQSWSDQDCLYAMATVPGTDWIITNTIKKNDIRRASYDLLSILTSLFLGLGIMTTVAILKIARKLSSPLQDLDKTTQKVSQNADFSLRASIKTHDEVGSLALSINQLIQWIGEYTDELNRIQAQLVQNEKMSALGEMMSGITHEINNPVSFIHGNLIQAEEYLQDLVEHLHLYQIAYPKPQQRILDHAEKIELDYLVEDLPEMLTSMQTGVDRIRGISNSMRIFSRADQDQKVFFDIHEGIDSTLLILRHRLKATDKRPQIQIIKEYGDLPQIVKIQGVEE